MPDNENLEEVVGDEPQYEYVTDPMVLDSTGQDIKDSIDGVSTALAALAGSISPTADNVSFDNTGTNIDASKVQGALVELDDEKVSKSGDTMTGALEQTNSSPKYTTVNSDVTLSSDEHNGLSATKNQRLTFNDSTNNDSRYIGRVYCEANVNGNNRIGFQVGNMNTSGSFQNSNFFMYKYKDGSTAYSVTDPAAFRDAIGVTITELTYSGTTNANGLITTNIDFDNKIIGFRVDRTASSTSHHFALMRPNESNKISFVVVNDALTLAGSLDVTISIFKLNI